MDGCLGVTTSSNSNSNREGSEEPHGTYMDEQCDEDELIEIDILFLC